MAGASGVGGHRVVTLDSLVPGEVAGRVGAEQLSWLGTVVAGRLGVVPVRVGPAVDSRIDLSARPGLVRAVRGAAATVVDLGRPGSPLCHVVPATDPRAGALLHLADAVTGVPVTG